MKIHLLYGMFECVTYEQTVYDQGNTYVRAFK